MEKAAIKTQNKGVFFFKRGKNRMDGVDLFIFVLWLIVIMLALTVAISQQYIALGIAFFVATLALKLRECVK